MDPGDLVLNALSRGVNTGKTRQVIEAIYGKSCSHACLARMCRVAEEEVEAFWMRPLKIACLWVMAGASFFSLRRDSCKKEPTCIAQGTGHEGRRRPSRFFLMGPEGGSSHAWREIFREPKERGVERIGIVVSGDLPGAWEAVGAVFPEADRKLFCLHAVRKARTKVRRSGRHQVLSSLKAICQAPDVKGAEHPLPPPRNAGRSAVPSWCATGGRTYPARPLISSIPRRHTLKSTPPTSWIGSTERQGGTLRPPGVLSSEESLLSVLHLVLKNVKERLGQRRLGGFCETEARGGRLEGGHDILDAISPFPCIS